MSATGKTGVKRRNVQYVIDDNMQFRNKNNDIEDFDSFPFYFYILTLTYHNYNTLRHIKTLTIYGSTTTKTIKSRYCDFMNNRLGPMLIRRSTGLYMHFIVCGTSLDPDQQVHLCSLIRICTVCCMVKK